MTKITSIEGIGPANADKLAAANVKSVEALLEAGATKKGRKGLAEQTGIGEAQILKWVNLADMFRVKGISTQYSELLEAAGVDSVPELSKRKPANLYKALVAANDEKKLVRQTPSEKVIEGWVAQAKELPRMVKH
jgi:predicted flap endonuclease-1-like 5' DNA nuclease